MWILSVKKKINLISFVKNIWWYQNMKTSILLVLDHFNLFVEIKSLKIEVIEY